MNFNTNKIKVVKLDIPPDEELPDLDNLSPEEEKALDEKVGKTLAVLSDALGDFGDEEEETEEGEEGAEDGEDDQAEEEGEVDDASSNSTSASNDTVSKEEAESE